MQGSKITHAQAQQLNRAERRKLGKQNGGAKIYGSTKPYISPKRQKKKHDKTR